MGDGIIKTVVGTPVGVHTDVLDDADVKKDVDGDSFVEPHEAASPEDWDRIVEDGREAEWDRISRTQVGRTIKGVADSIGKSTMRISGAAFTRAMIDAPISLRATTTVARNAAGSVVGPMAAGVSIAKTTGFAYLRGEDPDWGEVAAIAAWEGVSWAAAGVLGTGTAAATTGLLTPVGGALAGIAVTYTAKQTLDAAKDGVVLWAYSFLDQM